MRFSTVALGAHAIAGRELRIDACAIVLSAWPRSGSKRPQLGEKRLWDWSKVCAHACPCGARGDPAVECCCSAQRLNAYRDKLSRALLDRFDLVVAVPRPRAAELAAGPSEPTAAVAERVGSARELLAVAPLPRTAEADELLSRAVERLPLSGRGRARVGRVARTIAALAGAEQVRPEHLAEALAYRSPQELGT